MRAPRIAADAAGGRPAGSRVKTVIKRRGSEFKRVYRYRGSYPGYGFPRVRVGEYTVRTTAWCRGQRRTRNEVVNVREKTAERTVSRSEWRRIRRGMPVEQVRRIIGYNGSYAGRYRGKVLRTYDMMRFWRWSLVTYRNGRVVSKAWNVPHD